MGRVDLKPQIAIFVGKTKEWHAYLGIKSNPEIPLDGMFQRAIFFDDPKVIAPLAQGSGAEKNQYFYIFWNGLYDEAEMEQAEALLGADADLTGLVVGYLPPHAKERYKVQEFFAEGPFRFSVEGLRFDSSTAKLMLQSRLKTLLMPAKNILQEKVEKSEQINLLLGKKRIVFCGSYGTVPMVIRTACERYSTDFHLFDAYEYYCNDPAPSLETYKKYVRKNGLFLAGLYGRSDINDLFFQYTMHLLGREYFIERIRAAGLELFAHAYATGININVYTTPFYQQHVFIDFGSAVGAGNYPRLADLTYFKKKFIPVALGEHSEEILAMARAGSLDDYFERRWELYEPGLRRAMQ
jgi:SAM-dependent methyltransferase